jgi:hypothetical protein
MTIKRYYVPSDTEPTWFGCKDGNMVYYKDYEQLKDAVADVLKLIKDKKLVALNQSDDVFVDIKNKLMKVYDFINEGDI